MKIIEQMKQLDDKKKIEVEAFDDKTLAAFAVIGSFLTFLGSANFVDPVFDTPVNCKDPVSGTQVSCKVSFEGAAPSFKDTLPWSMMLS